MLLTWVSWRNLLPNLIDIQLVPTGNKTSDNANVTKTSTAEIKLKSLTLPRKKKESDILSPKPKDFAKPSFFDDFKESNSLGHSIKERFGVIFIRRFLSFY